MSDATRIASLEGSLADVAAYLDELRSALASHDAALGSQRLTELEQRIAPAGALPVVPQSPWSGSREASDVSGKISLYSDISNAMGDPTFESVPVQSPPSLTTSWQLVSRYWEARYTVVSGTDPTYFQIFVSAERAKNDYNSSRAKVYVVNQSGSTITGQVVVELRSRPTPYSPQYDEPPYVVGSVRADQNLAAAPPAPAEVSVELRTIGGGDVVRAASSFRAVRSVQGQEFRAERHYAATDLTVVPNSLVGWYLLIRVRLTYTSVPTATTLAYLSLVEPQLVQAWTPDPPPYAPNLGYWRPFLTDGMQPYAYQPGFDPTGNYTTALSLPANGGMVAIPIVVTARMDLRQVSLWNTDAASARTWNWALYDSESFGPEYRYKYQLQRITNGSAAESFTPGAASKRTITAAGISRLLLPGVYWLVVQNLHATNTFGVGYASTGTLSHNRIQTRTHAMPWASQVVSSGYGLVDWYRLGETGATATDSGTGAKNGTYYGSPAQGEPGLGSDANLAAKFNGVDQYVATATVPLATTDNWAVGALVRVDGYPASYGTVVHNGTNSNGYGLYVNSTGGLVGILQGVRTIPTSATLLIGRIYHVAIVRTSGTTRVYLDSTQVDTGGPYTDVPATPTTRLSIGSVGTSGGSFASYLAGTVDEVYVLNAGISASQVGYLFTAASNYSRFDSGAGWSKSTSIVAAVLEGESFGAGSVF